MCFFDIKTVDLFDCGLSKSVKPIAIIDDISASVQELFVYSGFWKILSFCIGRKNEDKTKIPLLTKIQEALERTDYVDFTTRPALQEACRIYHPNFSNIYSKRNCQAMLKTVINLVLKVNLCRQRIFGEKKKKKTYKRKQRKRPKPQSEQAKKKQALEKLFWLLDCDHRVDQCIDKQLGIIFSNNKKKPESKEPAAAKTTGAPSPVSRKGKSRMSATSSPQPLSTTDAEQDIELLDSDDSDLESVMDDELQEEEESRDLTAKEINALTSVSVMLCQSPSIKGDISSEHIKKQLYPDKRDSIPASALDCCCTIINAIKSLVPKEDSPSIQVVWFVSVAQYSCYFPPWPYKEEREKSLSNYKGHAESKKWQLRSIP
ncbi:uncharacterized protein ATC70_008864 [Mucor velutinosus]|uniref:Uncharacterized protein n=1 Tax=Mucor velutinosus TaxID=708070 RepID=A0AAN7HP77_9FUNG|nr:hypothetical protein ATC70_008864 [Mucor velutinosus]